MKNQSFAKRVTFAASGIVETLKSGLSFKIQFVAACLIFALLALSHASPIWWALIALNSGAIFAAELFNTALENLADALHPSSHPLVGKAKDCAAGAVLTLCFTSLVVFAAFIIASFLSAGS